MLNIPNLKPPTPMLYLAMWLGTIAAVASGLAAAAEPRTPQGSRAGIKLCVAAFLFLGITALIATAGA